MIPPRPPRGLQQAGRRAWRAARESVGADRAEFRELVELYAFAVDRARSLRAQWEREGRPTTSLYHDSPVAHPLLGLLERADEQVRKLAHELALSPTAPQSARRGRPPGRDPISALGLGGLRVVK